MNQTEDGLLFELFIVGAGLLSHGHLFGETIRQGRIGVRETGGSSLTCITALKRCSQPVGELHTFVLPERRFRRAWCPLSVLVQFRAHDWKVVSLYKYDASGPVNDRSGPVCENYVWAPGFEPNRGYLTGKDEGVWVQFPVGDPREPLTHLTLHITVPNRNEADRVYYMDELKRLFGGS